MRSAFLRVASVTAVALFLIGSPAALAQVSLTTLGSPYTQNFDTLATTGTTNAWADNTTIPGWYAVQTIGTLTVYRAGDGSTTNGALYSFGTGTNAERALGSVSSGTPGNFFYGVRLVNNTGGNIDSILVAYNGEQWRNGGNVTPQTLAFSYQVANAGVITGINTPTTGWTAVTALDFVTPIATATAGALDGNAAANRTAKSATITFGAPVANGQEIWVRWNDVNDTGNDHGVSVDDLSVTPQAASPLPNLTINDVTLAEGNAGTTTFTFTVSLSAPAGAGGVTFDIATADGTVNPATQPSDYTLKSLTGQTIPSGSSTYTFDVLVNGDTTPETNETFFVNVTNVTGANVTDGQGLGTITNDDAAPNLTINDVTLAEGNAGTTTFTFTVSLSAPAPPGGVTFDIATADNTATQPSDYTQKSLTGQTIPAGSSTYTFDVLVNGDLTVEANETFFVNVTNVLNAIPTDGQGLGTITNDDLTQIHDIQGSGTTSPLSGVVTTHGIVTGLRSNGFFIQTPDAEADGNPNTSEGIFVFTSAAPPAAAVIGNDVQVTGTIQEFVPTQDVLSPPVTELVTPTVTLNSSGNPLPAEVTITAADTLLPGIENLEKWEGMRVTVSPSLTTVAPTQGNITETSATSTTNGVFYAVVTGVARPFREAGIMANDPPPSGSGVTICPTGAPNCVPRFDFNPERLRVNTRGLTPLGPSLDVTSGVTLTNVHGILHYDFRTYDILTDPSNPPSATANMAGTQVTTPTNMEFTVATANLERFFDTVNDPTTSDVVLTAGAYLMRKQKASLEIRNSLQMPDIVAVEEMENLTTLQDLAAQISSDAIAAAQPDPLYQAYLVDGNDVGGIDVGFLVKKRIVVGSTPRISGEVVVQENAGELFVNPDASTSLLNDRPPLRLTATVNNPGGASFPVTVIAVHQRSLSGIDDPGAETNGWASVGARVRAKRQKQAESLAALVQAHNSENLVVLGDYNAFEVNDGYVDVMGTVMGTPTPASQVVLASTSPVTPPLMLLDTTAPAAQQYSYSFDGDAQTLDHILISQAMVSNTSARRIEHARINADFPEGATTRNNAAVPNRISDHDPAIGFFQVATFPVELTSFSAE